MHRTGAGPGASHPELVVPGTLVHAGPKILARDPAPQVRALFPPDQREGGREGSKGRGRGQGPGRREQGKPLKTKRQLPSRELRGRTSSTGGVCAWRG